LSPDCHVGKMFTGKIEDIEWMAALLLQRARGV